MCLTDVSEINPYYTLVLIMTVLSFAGPNSHSTFWKTLHLASLVTVLDRPFYISLLAACKCSITIKSFTTILFNSQTNTALTFVSEVLKAAYQLTALILSHVGVGSAFFDVSTRLNSQCLTRER